jgi:hypothetical protein
MARQVADGCYSQQSSALVAMGMCVELLESRRLKTCSLSDFSIFTPVPQLLHMSASAGGFQSARNSLSPHGTVAPPTVLWPGGVTVRSSSKAGHAAVQH